MSEIVLSASVRQNLLSLQSTANLLARTQNRLATGNKVNSALDNPTNFFTAQGLNARASDINNLLDSIGNGVQVLQAADKGISSLQKLVDSAKSVANQALQATQAYSSKSQTSLTIAGATPDNLLGTPDVTATTTGGPLTGASNAATVMAYGESLTINIDGQDVVFDFYDGNAGAYSGSNIGIDVQTTAPVSITTALGNIQTQLRAQGGAAAANATVGIVGGNLEITLGTNITSKFTITDGTTGLGLTDGTYLPTSSHVGETLTIASTAGGTATSLTLGTGAGQISNLSQLNNALAANNLQASVDNNGKITVTTANDYASQTIGTVGGTAGFGAPTSPVKDPVAQQKRADLVTQYNNIINQITTTAQDSSFNGVNLLNGDDLKLVFNETGSSVLNINGLTLDPAGLGLGALTAGTDFIDNSATNRVLDSLNAASTALRSQASALGSNLSIVQIRQDFSKNLIDVLQTGAANLTLADANEEAANSQALSTRQSIAVSALALANQSQQSILQLLR